MLDENDEKLKRGFIKLYRCLDGWEWYSDIPTKVLFIHILIKANHSDKNWQGIKIKKGSFVTSYQNLATETNLTYKQVRTAIKKLKMTGEVAHKGTSRYSIITVNNWEMYQDKGTQGAHKGHTRGTQGATTNNVKNEKNDKNIYIGENFKNFDIYINPIIDSFKKAYKKEFKTDKCYLDNFKINKLNEIALNNPAFAENLPEILKKFNKIKFSKGNKPTLKWLILEGGWAGILNGEYEQYIDKEINGWEL